MVVKDWGGGGGLTNSTREYWNFSVFWWLPNYAFDKKFFTLKRMDKLYFSDPDF